MATNWHSCVVWQWWQAKCTMCWGQTHKPQAPATHETTTKYWSKWIERLGIGISDFIKPILSTERHSGFTFSCRAVCNEKSAFFQTPLSGHPKPTKITDDFHCLWHFLLHLSDCCRHLKCTILCWYLGHPHWEGKSHYCLSLYLKWMNLYSQLRFGFKCCYYHDGPPLCAYKYTASLSSQQAQRQGNDIPQDICEPRALPLQHCCCCCLWMQMEW